MKSELRFRVSDVVRRSPAAIAPYRASALQYVLPNKATAFSQFSRPAGVQDHGRPVSARSGNHARYSPVMHALGEPGTIFSRSSSFSTRRRPDWRACRRDRTPSHGSCSRRESMKTTAAGKTEITSDTDGVCGFASGVEQYGLARKAFSARRIPECLELLRRAERLGYDPDECGASRWDCLMLSGRFEEAWRERS